MTLILSVSFLIHSQPSSQVLPREPNSQLPIEKKTSPWDGLWQKIRKEISRFKGETGLIIKDLRTGITLQQNQDRLFPSASLVKIPIMVACFKAAEEGLISLEENIKLRKTDIVSGSGILKRMPRSSMFSVERLIELMITHSDNTATNLLIDRLGLTYLNLSFQEFGLKNTNLSRKMMDFRSRQKGLENYTTAEDMAFILEKIYKKEYLCSEFSEKCLEFLKFQQVNDRIPRLLPDGVIVAHKTGLEREVCHDTGIVFTSQGEFLICILTRTNSGTKQAKRFISTIAAYAYDAFKENRIITSLIQ